MKSRDLKSRLYAQVARVGAAMSSPKRLELLELLAQGEKSVDTLAQAADIDVKLASAHLRVLREAQLVDARRDGKNRIHRLRGTDVSDLWVSLRELAQAHLAELQLAMAGLVAEPEDLTPESARSLLDKVRAGDVVLLDVRPEAEFRTAHIPGARSVPLDELEARIRELPGDKDIVAYCRGPFCVMSDAAVALLARHGLRARKCADGVPEWRAAGLPLEHETI
ncbi:metalloregulator ArsR/SmtB family transcription factor [Pandoraea sp.]|uniref:ArsR/SmtB family transcription factor n=1 Tax=Pandoraea sp. TaxID=1883445 RepID=UPI0011F6A637|nr:metalloregulator ArsR/SmtB family transcription factor [Pandoraea sp.]TAL54541.1 MAG: ArsR family transcriptional regulator [Pandoraea sp.]TAM15759.1 MAG: ArsR family transcriptional regulator [Pandoraea sp.]